MASVICTLFENEYHYGVAALLNSLYKNGYRGEVFAGYRGSLPEWADLATPNASLNWSGSSTLKVSQGLQLHFLPLETDYHLTNYKPDFMLHLWEGPAKNASGLFYFDPDIVLTAPWSSFDEWITCGVALCEDVNSPLAEYHPRRVAWRRYFGGKNISLTFKSSVYANGGFIGVSKEDKRFLAIWKQLQEVMSSKIGGLNRSALTTTVSLLEADRGPFAPFDKTDQDALNASVEAWDGQVSFVGQEGMAFKSGAALMPHSVGRPKPWRWNPLIQSLNGNKPRQVDRDYWMFAGEPIRAHSAGLIRWRQTSIKIAAFISRFYKRS